MTEVPKRSSLRISVGLEEGPDGATRVHGLDLFGCVGSGDDQPAALRDFERELRAWLNFLVQEKELDASVSSELEITVDEWIRTAADVRAGMGDVLFAADRLPLAEEELSRGIRLLGGLRGRLVPRIRRARNQDLESHGRAGYSARVVLDELARGQWWLLTRLGASPLAAIPERVVGRLDTAMALIVQHLAHLPASARAQVLELDGEEWSARKVLRRLLWLEWTLGRAALDALDHEPAPSR